ncbi:EamA family transporter [Nonomuraea sp. SYSU D8015]|uniref:EamA family transporter n=1 Tax=Nonomuraea sp. SYSU D8015 TaxID=2593644 RepID=UPI001CB6E634|nr:EamA family transporter [Nonomuraea sp. SYSU D8015]
MRYAGLTLAIVSSWCFAFSGPMAKYLITAGLAPIEAVWTRMAAGLSLVAVLALIRPRALRITRARSPFFGLYAVMAVAGVQWLYFAAITRLPVGIALLLVYMAGHGGGVGAARTEDTARAGRLCGGGRRVAGLGIVVEAWQEIRLDALGLLLGLLAGACSAGYFLMSDSFGDDIDPLGLIAWGMTGAAVVLIPFARPWDIQWDAFTITATPAPGGGTLPVLVAYLWMVLVATVIAYILAVNAVRRLSAAVGATVASLEVVAGAIVAWAPVGETLGVFQIAGGLIMLSGALLAQTATRSSPIAQPESIKSI